MKIAISREFNYQGCPERCRKLRRMSGVYVDRVTLSSLTEEEAPILCEIERTETEVFGEEERESDIVVKYRFAQGCCWIPVEGKPEELIASVIKGAETSDYREEEARRRIAFKVKAFCNDHVIIGGVLHGVVSEPAWALNIATSFSYGDSITVEVGPDVTGEDVYRLDEFSSLEVDLPRIIEERSLHGARRDDSSWEEVPVYRRETVRLHRPDLLRRPSINHHRTSERLNEVRESLKNYHVRADLIPKLYGILDRVDSTALPAGVSVDDLRLVVDGLTKLSTLLLTGDDL